MIETCYSKGQKVILVTSQIKNGKWLCKFSIPGFNHLDRGLQDQDSSKGFKTEWEARTNAFQRAKLLLTGTPDTTQEPLLEKA
jgi:hypothetical protein